MSLTDSFSASRANSYDRCPKAYDYRYNQGLRMAPAWALKGRATHKAQERNYRQKVESRKDLPTDDLLDVFRTEIVEAFRRTDEEIVLFEGESQGQIVDDGVGGLRVYQAQLAPAIQPVMVEERVEVPLVDGTRLLGILDLVDEQMVIHDSKFVTDPIKAEDTVYQWQPPLYHHIYYVLTGTRPAEIRWDYVARGRAKKGPPNFTAASLVVPVTEARITAALEDLAGIQRAIAAGSFPHRRSVQNCSKCGYRRLCYPTGDPRPIAPPAMSFPTPPGSPQETKAQADATGAAAEAPTAPTSHSEAHIRHIASKSRPGETHAVDLTAGTCDCEAFAFRKSCSHLALARAGKAEAAEREAPLDPLTEIEKAWVAVAERMGVNGMSEEDVDAYIWSRWNIGDRAQLSLLQVQTIAAWLSTEPST